MKTQDILELYDKELRIQPTWPGRWREATPQIVRHIDTSKGRVSTISYAHLDADNVEEAIRGQIAYLEELGHQLSWLVCDHDTPADLKQRLISYSFEAPEPEAFLVLDVESMPAALLRPISADVRRITDPKDVHIVQSIHEQVWHDDYSAQCRSIADALQNYPERLSVYVVYADGVPVSCARASWMGPLHFTYLYGGCTLPDYQKRGFYSTLVAVRAREARRLGVRFLAVDAMPMSQPILLKLGFQCLTYSYKLRWQSDRA